MVVTDAAPGIGLRKTRNPLGSSAVRTPSYRAAAVRRARRESAVSAAVTGGGRNALSKAERQKAKQRNIDASVADKVVQTGGRPCHSRNNRGSGVDYPTSGDLGVY